MKLEHFIISSTKINSKWIKDLNVRLETIKLLEENLGRRLLDINHSNIFLNLSSKAKETYNSIVPFRSFCNVTNDKISFFMAE